MKPTAIHTPLFIAGLLIALAGCGDNARDTAVTEGPPATTAPPAATAPAETAAAAPTGALLDPNEATRDQLLSIEAIDSTTADALIEGRPYDDMLAVDRVLAAHLNEAQRDSVYTRLWRPIDLNTASAEEILLIPGLGERMEHEFEEYRPYRAMAEFREEIGKYVDEQEVARLEKYVTIR